MRRRETRTIGLLISYIENPYFTEIAHAVEATAYERGYNVILCNTDENLAKEIMYVDVFFAKQVDGLLLAPAPGDHTFLQTYLDGGAQVVLVNRYLPGISAPAVIRDDDVAMYELVSRVLQTGHRRLAAIIGIENTTTTQRCFAGLRRAVEENGLSPDDVQIFTGDARREGRLSGSQGRFGARAASYRRHLVQHLDARGVPSRSARFGPSGPAQIETTGFGYSALARAYGTCTYYVAQPSYRLGRVAGPMLLDALTGMTPLQPGNLVLNNKLAEYGPMSGANPNLLLFQSASPAY